MSNDLSSIDDGDLGSSVSSLGGLSLRTMLLLYGVLCAVVVGAYFVWIRPAMNRTADAVAETRSTQDQLLEKFESSEQHADSLSAAVKAVQDKTEAIHKEATRVMNDVRNKVKDLEGVAVRTNTLVSQGSSDLGARIASKVFQKADLIPLRNRAEALTKQLDSLRDDFSDWTKMHEELLDGDRGKVVAADENLVARFASIELPTVTDLDVRNLTDVLPTLIKPIQDALEQDEPSLISLEAYTKRIDDHARKIHEASAAIRKVRVAIAAIEQKAQPTRVTEDTPTLRKAIEQYEVHFAGALQTKHVEETQNRLDALAKQLADEDVKDKALAVKIEMESREAERNAQQEKHELEMNNKDEKRQAELTTIAAKQEADLRIEQQKREFAELEPKFQAALPEIRAYLRPYTAQGYNQPSGQRMVPTSQKGPVSLSAIRHTGALRTGSRSVSHGALATLSLMTITNNDRPTGGFPIGVSGGTMSRLQKVQSLLIEFGDIMVEKGMLAE